jgi:hypothetical protein
LGPNEIHEVRLLGRIVFVPIKGDTMRTTSRFISLASAVALAALAGCTYNRTVAVEPVPAVATVPAVVTPAPAVVTTPGSVVVTPSR